MIQFLCFFVAPLLAVFMFEKVNAKKLSNWGRVSFYALMILSINAVLVGVITFISGHTNFLLGDGTLYSAKFVFKYLASSLFLALVVIPYGYYFLERRESLKITEHISDYLLCKEKQWHEYWPGHRVEVMIVVVSFMAFLFMMLHNIMHSALWGDEWVEFNISQRHILNGDMYKAVIGTFQPPLYNWLMHFWLKIDNESLLWFRLFNIIPGIISGVCLFMIQLRLFGNKLAGCAALIVLGLSYHWIFVIQECSEYALMLMFLFVALYFYVEYKRLGGFRQECMFVLSCIGAMYSQYGAAFVVAPLLLVHLVERVFIDKNIILKAKTCGLYLCGLLLFAIPLYRNYMRIQMQNNKLSAYSNLQVTSDELIGIFTQFGLNVGFLWHLNSIDFLKLVLSYLWLPFMMFLLYVAFKKYRSTAMFNITLVVLFGYVMHYILVIMHIYAMVHPNQSSGFFARYSYFYIPILAVLLPAGMYAFMEYVPKKFVLIKMAIGVLSLAGLFCFTWPSINQNWHKAYDDVYAKIWVDRKGYTEPTYLMGACYNEAFEWYVTKAYGKEYKKQVRAVSAINMDDLPKVFWLWRTNWGGKEYDVIYEKARANGYEVEVFRDDGLARFCANEVSENNIR